MPREVYLYDSPERFVVGTVGQPGERTFFLQARSGPRITSVVLEKVQVAVLAERLDQILDELVLRSGGTAPVPATAPAELDDTGPLEQPIVEEFRVGTLALAWDADLEMVIIEAQAANAEENAEEEDDDEEEEEEEADEPSGEGTGLLGDDEDGPPVLRVRISGARARAFTKRALQVVAAGRPPCPFCGLPLDSEGHVCPRQNGYRGA
jgi:uncharacterized repeat protein (TIGR03847 family)